MGLFQTHYWKYYQIWAITKIMQKCIFIVILVYTNNRFHVAVCLFSNRSQMTSKCGENKKVVASVSLIFLPHFAIFCDLFLNRYTATWNLLVLYNIMNRKEKQQTCLIVLGCLIYKCKLRHYFSKSPTLHVLSMSASSFLCYCTCTCKQLPLNFF